MGIVAAYAVPHPPLIVPAVGRGKEREIQATIDAMQAVAKSIVAHRPDVIVVTSPHSPWYRNGFFISDAIEEIGTMTEFGAPDEQLGILTDLKFAMRLAQVIDERRIPTAGPMEQKGTLDHASYVPLHFLAQEAPLDGFRLVRLGLSNLPAPDHEYVGRCIARVADEQDKRVVLIASGDWSHKLTEDGPYGFDPAGPRFDEAVADIFRRGALTELYDLDAAMCEDAAECGLRSFWILAGALKGAAFESELLSYEGPFGVGYGVAAFEVLDTPDSSQEEVAGQRADVERRTAQAREAEEAVEAAAAGASATDAPATQALSLQQRADASFTDQVARGADPLVALARTTVEAFVLTREVPRHPDDTPEELLARRAGVFVSLHRQDALRGCIGTIFPVRSCIADEIIRNAVSAACEDPRFHPVRPEELDWLSYSVDVLGEPEPVESLEQLDPKRYGVIVTSGRARGLLLPDLEGVDTVADQLDIAKRKAGIPADADVKVERFEVVRHTAGGEARA